jgi:hypothetical protein
MVIVAESHACRAVVGAGPAGSVTLVTETLFWLKVWRLPSR